MNERTSLPPGEHDELVFDPLIDDFEPKQRSYIHFDAPLSSDLARKLSSNPDKVAKHSFFPFLGFTAVERRYKRTKGALEIIEKPRDIRYASHADTAIYEFYSKQLSELYELYLDNAALSKSILAYRSGIGSNIDHAGNLFSEVRDRGDCTCVALDISGFFDNLQHSILKSVWCKLLNAKELPIDQYKIFKRLTSFEWATKSDLETRLGRKLTAGPGRRICLAKEFREKVRDVKPSIVHRNSDLAGIPQGSALSGLLANIYLSDVDATIKAYCADLGASYRRYSDDIAIVLPSDIDAEEVINTVSKEYSGVGLSLNDKKTEIAVFSTGAGAQSSDRPFQYLGFTFDGQRTLIRDSSLNRYYRKMTRSIRAARIQAQKKKIPLNSVFLRRHYKTYTHKGKGRNFVRYGYRAAEKLHAPEIRKQLRNHTKIFHRKIAEEFTL